MKRILSTIIAISMLITPSYTLKIEGSEMEETLNSTVKIELKSNINATGFIIKHSGKYYIVTALHVVNQSPYIGMVSFVLHNGTKSIAFVKYSSERTDICILEVVNNVLIDNMHYLKISHVEANRMEDLYYCGHPTGFDYTTAKGYLSGYDRKTLNLKGLFNQYSFDNIGNGSSGSPIINEDNKVVGIIISKINDGEFVFGARSQDIIKALESFDSPYCY